MLDVKMAKRINYILLVMTEELKRALKSSESAGSYCIKIKIRLKPDRSKKVPHLGVNDYSQFKFEHTSQFFIILRRRRLVCRSGSARI